MFTMLCHSPHQAKLYKTKQKDFNKHYTTFKVLKVIFPENKIQLKAYFCFWNIYPVVNNIYLNIKNYF